MNVIIGPWNHDYKIIIQKWTTHNKVNSVVTERLIRTLKNKNYKYLTSISKNVFVDKLDDAVNKLNNKYHSTIKIKPADVSQAHILISIKRLI